MGGPMAMGGAMAGMAGVMGATMGSMSPIAMASQMGQIAPGMGAALPTSLADQAAAAAAAFGDPRLHQPGAPILPAPGQPPSMNAGLGLTQPLPLQQPRLAASQVPSAASAISPVAPGAQGGTTASGTKASAASSKDPAQPPDWSEVAATRAKLYQEHLKVQAELRASGRHDKGGINDADMDSLATL